MIGTQSKYGAIRKYIDKAKVFIIGTGYAFFEQDTHREGQEYINAVDDIAFRLYIDHE